MSVPVVIKKSALSVPLPIAIAAATVENEPFAVSAGLLRRATISSPTQPQ